MSAAPEHALEVVGPGPLSTVQDLGRPGWASTGVGLSGAAVEALTTQPYEVTSADVDRAAQVRPGQRLRFHLD